jgi:LmbE family N-acetylglucosaminyl deacetylase
VVVVFATRGDLGEVAPGVLSDGEMLAQRREEEARAAATLLGVARVEFLGFRDSGMAGDPENEHPQSFWSADVQSAARRLSALLSDEAADVLTIYDPNGGYGHPDHVQVHRVGARAADLAGTAAVFEATMNRDHVVALIRAHPEFAPDGWEDPPDLDTMEFGSRASQITTVVDVRDLAPLKRQALALHSSQVGPDHFMLAMPDEAFREAFGWEWFIRRGAAPGTRESSLFDVFG